MPASDHLVLPNRGDLVRRTPIVVFGLIWFGVGISMLLLANLGAAPWDLLHQGLENVTGISLCMLMEVTNCVQPSILDAVPDAVSPGTDFHEGA